MENTTEQKQKSENTGCAEWGGAIAAGVLGGAGGAAHAGIHNSLKEYGRAYGAAADHLPDLINSRFSILERARVFNQISSQCNTAILTSDTQISESPICRDTYINYVDSIVGPAVLSAALVGAAAFTATKIALKKYLRR
jgi:hypothetical protein